MLMGEHKILRKVCMLGEFAVGKTNLASRFTQNTFNETYISTMGARVSKKEITKGDTHITMMVWDLIGFIKYEKLIASYTKGSDVGIVVYDVSRKDTFDFVVKWANLFTMHEKNRPIILLANKMDIGPKYDAEALGAELAQEKGWTFFMTSAKTGLNVEQAFLTAAEINL